MLVSISILCFNKAEVTFQCLKILEKTITTDNIEVIITNNGSVDVTEQVILSSNLKNKVYIKYGKNIGFIKAHNEALKIARGSYFIALNNDMLITEQDWIYKLLKPLEDDLGIALTGIANSPNSLRNDGTGYYGREVEYIDGACIAGRTEDFLRYGLFSEDFKMFYCEDSDLSLRMRQMGFRLETVLINHRHARSTTADTIDKEYRNNILKNNLEVFNKKWGTYLRSRSLTNNILVKATSQGYGDIICITPLLESLRKQHPEAKIEVETAFPEVFINNPYITEIFPARKRYTKAYDRIIDLTLDYSKYDLIIKEASRVTGISVNNYDPQIFITNDELSEGAEIVESLKGRDGFVICCATQMSRKTWQGRNWLEKYNKELIEKLEKNGVLVIEIGKNVPSSGEASLDLIDKTTLREMFSIIANCDAFIGCDSGPAHVAQAFKIPSFIIFGAVEPYSRIIDFSTTFPIRDENLPCIGCYQEKGKSTWNKCLLGNELCMENITPDVVLSYVFEEIDPKESNIRYLQNIIQKGFVC